MDDRYKIILLTVILAALSLLIVVPGLTAANYEFFLWQRVPKLAAILITGGAIAFSAVVFQTMTHNRILTPATLGFDALYLFIQVGVFFFLGAGSFLVVDRKMLDARRSSLFLHSLHIFRREDSRHIGVFR